MEFNSEQQELNTPPERLLPEEHTTRRRVTTDELVHLPITSSGAQRDLVSLNQIIVSPSGVIETGVNEISPNVSLRDSTDIDSDASK